MPVYKCDFDPDRDLQPTIPSLAISISKAIETGVVFDTGTIPEGNDIESPDSIWCRVTDALHAAQLEKEFSTKARASMQPNNQAVNPVKGGDA